jgi:hypothetical protein
MLVFARTATRFREMHSHRLGASRTRIVSQIFGDAGARRRRGRPRIAINWLGAPARESRGDRRESTLPYWLSLDVTGGDLLRALLFAVISATVAGRSAMRITGKPCISTCAKSRA